VNVPPDIATFDCTLPCPICNQRLELSAIETVPWSSRTSGERLVFRCGNCDIAQTQWRAASVLDAAVKKVGRVQVMADRIREELGRILPRKTVTKKAAGQGISGDDRNVVEFPIGHSAPAKDIVLLRKS
jgi:hypothetical protein